MSVVASMVVGSDGSTSKDSKSAGVSSPADRRAFLSRRRSVDCIIIGGNTARNEPYNRTPVPLVVLSRSLVNPVIGNHLALMWNTSPADAIERALRTYGSNILIEDLRDTVDSLRLEHSIHWCVILGEMIATKDCDC